jgi:hypothetical protein
MHYLESFRSLVSKVSDAYICSVHSYVGLKSSAGIHLLSGRVLFQRTRPAANELPFSFESTNIVAGKFLCEAGPDEIAAALARAEFGQMKLAHEVAVILPNANSDRFDDYYYPAKLTFPAVFSVRGISWRSLLTASNRAPALEWDLPGRAANPVGSHFPATRRRRSTSVPPQQDTSRPLQLGGAVWSPMISCPSPTVTCIGVSGHFKMECILTHTRSPTNSSQEPTDESCERIVRTNQIK